MGYLFTSESVSEGHPDKVADQISDAVLDNLLFQDPQARVACETLVTTGQVIVAGEIRSTGYIDLQTVVRDTIRRIGYTKAEYQFDADSCGILNAIHEQSADISRGVIRQNPEDQGAGDQGMMFGYATNETDTYLPLPLSLAHDILIVLAEIRREGKEMTYLRPDSKSQVTIEYADDGRPMRIATIVVSTQHDEFITAGEAGSQEAADAQMLARAGPHPARRRTDPHAPRTRRTREHARSARPLQRQDQLPGQPDRQVRHRRPPRRHRPHRPENHRRHLRRAWCPRRRWWPTRCSSSSAMPSARLTP